MDVAVEEAKKSPFPDLKAFWTDIYVSGRRCTESGADVAQYKGTEPPYMRGREKEEVHHYSG